MNNTSKTIFCDIDGTLISHTGNIITNLKTDKILTNVKETLQNWDKLNYRFILTTGRKESSRKQTEDQLISLGIIYDQLIMGLPNGSRILINDKKPNGIDNTAYAINLVRNKGFDNIDISSKNITIPDKFRYTKIEKPWGYEELVECNDKYVVKKLFMKKGNKCSLQYHELKRETIIVLSGTLKISTGNTLDNITHKEYQYGDTITIDPYTIHRMEAVEDSLYTETSTNELWDVIRIQDDYGRECK